MDKFNILLDNNEVAKQIATLLNSYNRLTKLHTSQSILNSNIKYFIKEGIINSEMVVVGCVGAMLITTNAIYIKHLSIHNAFRKQGIATSLLKKVQISFPNIKYFYMDIRSDNYASLYLAEKEKFLITKIKPQIGYNIVTVGKING